MEQREVSLRHYPAEHVTTHLYHVNNHGGGGPAIEYSWQHPWQLHGGSVIHKNLRVAKLVKKFSCILGKPKVHYRVYKNLLLVHCPVQDERCPRLLTLYL
jgi:hypothetical protein